MTETRTTQQNKALHKLFNDISNYCVETGIDQKALVDQLESYSVPTSPQAIKEIWRTIQVTLTGKQSTKDLTRKEIDQKKIILAGWSFGGFLAARAAAYEHS